MTIQATSGEKPVRSAHPVEPRGRGQIMQELEAIEREHQVRVLFACESGSRGWGFASPDSDYDVRFVYVHRLPRYLTVDAGRDVIERPISGELDINGWDLRKALRLLRDSNPTLLEWLQSPILYRAEQPWTGQLHRLAQQWFSPVRGYHHYVSMAKKNLREHLYGELVRYKKYLYVMRPLLAARWIREGRGTPPMRFAELAGQTVTDAVLRQEIDDLLAIKMRAGEAATSPRWEGIHRFIERELEAAMAYQPPSAAPQDGQVLDRFLYDVVMHFHSG